MSTDASAGERTKFKALVRYYVEGKQHALGKPNEPLADEKVASLAKILEVSASNKSATHPTRPDKRFPNQNQVNSCWQAVNEYQVCVYQRGEKDAACLQRGRDYNTQCPQKWIDDWKSQAAEGRNLTVGTTFM